MNIVLSSIGALKNTKESARITLFLLAKELQAQGHEVRIIAKGKDPEEIEKMEEIDGVKVYRAALSGIPFLLRRLHVQQKIDLVHSFSASPLFLLPHLFGPWKTVHTLKSYSKQKIGRYGYSILALADKVTVPTAYVAAQLSFPKKAKKVQVVYSLIDMQKFSPQDPEHKQQLKIKYGYDTKKVVFYYGALWEEKGVNVLLKSIPQLMKKIPETTFVFAPRYQNIREQQELIRELGVEDQIQWVMDNIPIEDYVNLADVVVLPYLNMNGTEGNPSCMLEAMACKTTVVTSNLPELTEIGEGSVLFAEPSDSGDLAKTISAALTMKSKEKQKMLEKAYAKSTEFDSKIIAQEFVKLYTHLKAKTSR